MLLAPGASTWAWYDFSDLSSMFQDTAGATPVTAVEQPIGRINDKSGNGWHATQGTAAARPVLRARYNFVTYSEDLSNAAWTRTNATLGTGVSDPLGGTTAFTVTATAPNGFARHAVTTTIGAGYTGKIWVRRRTGTGGVRIYSGEAFDSTIITAELTTSWQEFTTTDTSDTGTGFFGVLITTSGDAVDIWRPDFRATNLSSSLPVYQRIGAATDYDTAGFPLYAAFDGTDDSLATGTITPGAVDKAQVFAGVRKLSDAATGVVVESSPTSVTNPGVILMRAPRGVAPSYGFGSTGTLFSEGLANSGYAAPITNVLTGLGDISGDRSTLRINGSQINQSTADQGTGDYLAYSLFIGARAGTSFFFNGWMYGLIVRFSATNLDAASISQAENWMNGKTGAY
jgi:hypothetical protein